MLIQRKTPAHAGQALRELREGEFSKRKLGRIEWSLLEEFQALVKKVMCVCVRVREGAEGGKGQRQDR